MAGGLKNIGGYGERFGNLPLPVEQSGKAAEGELMVGRTTGHMYVRNGGKNVSKTVELEDFLNNLRLGSMNWIRNSGDFYEDLARNDWYYDEVNHRGHLTFESDDATGRKFIRVRTGSLTGWKYISNKIGSYYKLNLKKDTKICISLMCRASKNINITVKIDNVAETAPCTSSQVINITTEWTKYEAILTTNGVPIDSSKIIYIKIPDGENNVDFDIMYAQMEPGDRSSEWRPSWLDYYQRLQYTDNNTRNWVTDQVNKAISNCHNYTDSEINKLNGNLQNIINQAINNCKTYTNQEISKVNTRIDNEVDELIHRDMIQRVHLNLGNQDYTKYLTNADNTSIDKTKIYYSEEDRGIIVKGEARIVLNLPIPIDPDSKYYMRSKIMAKTNDTRYYIGADTLDANYNSISTDNAESYNYGVMNPGNIPNGGTLESDCIFSGYNTTDGANVNKFDPYGKYFRAIFVCNFVRPQSVSVIKSIEIVEIPKALWNALDPGPRNRDGLMSIADKTKLDGIEERANRYIHPATDGNLHVPATGTTNNNKVLTAGSTPGSLRWVLPSTDSHTLDGFGLEKFLREVPIPSHRDLNQFRDRNAFFTVDSGQNGNVLNTPHGTMSGEGNVAMVINRYTTVGLPRIQQEFIRMYPSETTTKYVRNGTDSSWGPWVKVYTTSDRPTPAEVGAVNKTGDSMSGDLTMTSGIIRTPNNSKGIMIGDDIYLADQNEGNHLVLLGGQDNAQAGITFGSGKDTNIYRGGANLLKTDDTFNAAGGLQWNGQSLDDRYSDRNMQLNNGRIITVEGESTKYYPVIINLNTNSKTYAFSKLSISRHYNDPAPGSWGYGNNKHKVGLTLSLLWSGDDSWGGNSKTIQVLEFDESYDHAVGGIKLCAEGLVVWLRGGNTQYRIDSEYGLAVSATVKLQDFNEEFRVRNDNSQAMVEIGPLYQNRKGQLYDSNQRVYSPLNKPTPGDIGAVNKVGDTMSGSLKFESGAATSSTTQPLQLGYNEPTNTTGYGYMASYGRIKILADTDNNGSEPIQLVTGNGLSTDETKGLVIWKDNIKYNNNPIWHQGHQGSGTGMDADKLDGLHSGSFLRTDADSSLNYTKIIKIDQTSGDGPEYTPPYDRNLNGISGGRDGASNKDANLRLYSWQGIGFVNTIQGYSVPQFENATWFNVRDGHVYTRGQFYANSDQMVWHQGNDGAGSGLDADLLDGEHASAFVHKTGDIMSGPLKFTANRISDVYAEFQIGKSANNNAAVASYSALQLLANTDNGAADEPVQIASGVGLTTDLTRGLTVYRNDIKYNNNTVWHAGNDGSGSGLDADLLDGLHSTAFVKRSGDSMTGELTMSNDDTGITFYDGARIYKKSGSGLIIKTHNNDIGVKIVSTTEDTMLKVTTTETTASGNLKGKNLDLGRYSIKYNSDTGSLDFIFE